MAAALPPVLHAVLSARPADSLHAIAPTAAAQNPATLPSSDFLRVTRDVGDVFHGEQVELPQGYRVAFAVESWTEKPSPIAHMICLISHTATNGKSSSAGSLEELVTKTFAKLKKTLGLTSCFETISYFYENPNKLSEMTQSIGLHLVSCRPFINEEMAVNLQLLPSSNTRI